MKQADFLARVQKAEEDALFEIRELKFYDGRFPKMKVLTKSTMEGVKAAIDSVGLSLDKIIEEREENGKNKFSLIFRSL